MGFLLAKIFVLLLLAALFGALLYRWWSRRFFEKVTIETNTKSDLEWQAWRRSVDGKLDQTPVLQAIHNIAPPVQTDLSDTHRRIDALSTALAAIKIPTPQALPDFAAMLAPLQNRMGDVEACVKAINIPQPKEVDMSPLSSRLGLMETAVKAIHIPAAKEVDLSAVNNRLNQLEAAIKAIHIPAAKEVDLAPMNNRLNQLDAAIKAIHIPAAKDVDLTPVNTRLGQLDAAVKAIHIPTAKEVDLAPMNNRLNQLEAAIKAIQIPPHKEPDLIPIQTRLNQVEAAIRAIQIPAAKDVDLQPVNTRLAQVETAIKAIQIPAPREVNFDSVNARISALELSLKSAANAAPRVDLAPMELRIGQVQEALRNLPRPAPAQTIDLAPTQTRLSQLEEAVRAIRIPAPVTVDNSLIIARLAAIEAKLNAPTPRPEPRPAPAPVVVQAAPAVVLQGVRSGSRNLLSRPVYGKPDDLKLIKGVATVMEKMLHDIGVYYFWQIADWDAKDVQHADDQLPVFKGRITRDEWVKQSKAFAKLASSARRPE